MSKKIKTVKDLKSLLCHWIENLDKIPKDHSVDVEDFKKGLIQELQK